MVNNRNSTSDSSLNLAKVGTKNRICPPPKLVVHLDIRPGDHVAFILRKDKNDTNYATIHPIKEKNFEVEGEEITVENTFKK